MSIAASAHSEDEVFLGGDIEGIFRSLDGGTHWKIRNNGLRDYWINTIVYHPSDPNIVYVGGESGVHKSTDRGRHWRWLRNGFPLVSQYSFSAPVSVLALDPRDPNTIYAGVGEPRFQRGKQGALYKTTDGGESWSRANAPGTLPSDALITSLVFRPDGSALYLACQYGLFTSSDAGAHWTPHNIGLPHTNVGRLAVCRRHPETMYLTLYTSLNPSWTGGVYRSTDGGESWEERNNGLEKVSYGTSTFLNSNYRELVVHPDDPNTVYVGTFDWVTDVLFKTTDGGASWKPIVKITSRTNLDRAWNPPYGDTTQCLTISDLNPDRLYFAGGTVVRTDDGGATWEQVFTQVNTDASVRTTGLELTAARLNHIDPKNPTRVFFGYGDIAFLCRTTVVQP